MALVARASLALVAAATVAACSEPPTTFAVDAPQLPASTFVRNRPVRPAILGVWLSGGGSQDLGVIVRFSEPMDRDSVAAKLAVVAATETVLGPGQGSKLEPKGGLGWNPTSTEFLVFFEPLAGERSVVVTFADNVFGQSNLALDGTAGPRPGTDANSYHRFEDDGFNGPSTYVSLPYYPAGGDDLLSHPTFLQHNMRPGVRCDRFGSLGQDVTGGTLGEYDGDAIACRLWSRRTTVERAGVPERSAPRAWDPARLPQPRFHQSDVTEVAANLRVGRGGDFDPRAVWTVAETVGDHGLQIRDLVLADDADVSGMHFAPADAPEPLWPITGATPPDILWTNPVLATGTGSGTVTIVDADGRAWLADEFAGQTFFNGFDATARIRGNRANALELDSLISCPPCVYEIRTDIKRRYGVNDAVRLVADAFVVTPAESLPTGEWTLSFSGGRDLFGLRQIDGLRDGNEVAGVPDQRIDFSLSVP